LVKGYKGESCPEVMREIISAHQPLTFTDLFRMVSERGSWSDNTIYRQTMKWTVNLPPAYLEWPASRPRFLFVRPDGLFELYDGEEHGIFRAGTRVDALRNG
jgi:hypothetical protein